MTILEIESLIDAATLLVNQEVAAAAMVPVFVPYQSKIYSDLFWSRMLEELAPIPLDPGVSEFRTSADFDKCSGRRILVVEYFFDEVGIHHDVRHEVEDLFYEAVH